MESKVLAEPVLVGRAQELDQLQRFLDLASEGKGNTILVSAEAGVGKTRLLQEFINSEKQNKNSVILSGWCLFNAGIPYFPFIEAFSNYYSALTKKSEEESELNSWLKGPTNPESTGTLQYLSPQALKDQTFVAVAKTIHSIASQNRVILLVDDIHWADSASLALLHYIARVVKDSERVLVLATFRSEELTSDSEGYPHPLVETLCMMKREDLFHELKLANLNQDCVAKIAESMLGNCLQQEFVEKLATTSEGNPLFVIESLRMLHEQKLLFLENNEWHLAIERLSIPSKIKDIIMKRITYLNNDQRRILDVASVIGEEFDVGLLSTVVQQDSLDVLETLNVIANRTSLICVDENRYRFEHSKSREVIYEALPQPLKLGYHARIAEKLEKLNGKTLPLSDLAFHYSQAGNKDKAVKFALSAAKDELKRWSNSEAINHFRYVLRNVTQQHSVFINERMSALEGLGDALRSSQMYKESINTFLKLANADVVDSLKLRALRKAGESAFELGDVSYLTEILNRARPYAAVDRLENARVLMMRAFVFHLQHDWLEEKKNIEAASKVFEAKYSLWEVAWSLMMLGSIHGCYIERMKKKGISESLLSIALFGELGDFRMQMIARMTAGTVFNSCSLESEASRVFAQMIESEEKNKTGDYLRLAIVYGMSTWPLIFRGNVAGALSLGLKSLEFSKKTDSPVPYAQILSRLILIYALQDNFENAEKQFERLIKLPPEIFSHEFVNGFLARAVVYACKGQWNESEQSFRECYNWLKTSPIGVWEQIVRFFHAWALERQGRVGEARALSQKLQKTHLEAEESFSHINLQVKLLTPARVDVTQSFEISLYLSNISRSNIRLIKMEKLIPIDFKIVSMPSFNIRKNGSVDMKSKELDSFQVESIKIVLQATKAGTFCLSPRIGYVDSLEKVHTHQSTKVYITVKPAKTIGAPIGKGKYEFKYEASEKAFNYLVKAFEEDLLRHKLLEEKSGWRSLAEVSRKAQVTMYSMYGRHGKGGEATRELRLLNAVESRFFIGERGQGGRVLKIRIHPEKNKY